MHMDMAILVLEERKVIMVGLKSVTERTGCRADLIMEAGPFLWCKFRHKFEMPAKDQHTFTKQVLVAV